MKKLLLLLLLSLAFIGSAYAESYVCAFPCQLDDTKTCQKILKRVNSEKFEEKISDSELNFAEYSAYENEYYLAMNEIYLMKFVSFETSIFIHKNTLDFAISFSTFGGSEDTFFHSNIDRAGTCVVVK